MSPSEQLVYMCHLFTKKGPLVQQATESFACLIQKVGDDWDKMQAAIGLAYSVAKDHETFRYAQSMDWMLNGEYRLCPVEWEDEWDRELREWLARKRSERNVSAKD